MNSHNIYHTVEVVSTSIDYTIEELCTVSNLDEEWVRQLEDYEIIHAESDTQRYNISQLRTLMKAYRLQRDLELNTAGVALALQLLETIEQQELELKRLRHQRL